MPREYSPPRKHIRNRLSAQCNLHREAHYSVLWLDEEDAKGLFVLMHAVQVTMDDGKRMHCGGLFFSSLGNDNSDPQ